MINIDPNDDLIVQNTLVSSFTPIQAFGVCFLKSSMDPIARISALFYHKIISINQAPTKSYWDSMLKEVTIEKQEHKKQLF